MFMKLTGLLLCSISLNAMAEDLTVEIRHVKPNVGVVVVGLYDKAADFPATQKGLAGQVIGASSDTVTATFHDLAAGRYAVAVYQDENSNGKLDKNFLGLPTEPYGFSNDARGSLGPPSFDDAVVNPTTTPKIVINLH